MATLSGSTVLVVDASDAHALVHALRADGHQVLVARTGLEAFDHLAAQPDLVVLDLVLPVVTGLEVLATIRQRATTPVIVHTDLRTEETIVRSLDVGADDFVVKPASPRELAARVRALLRRSGVTANRDRIVHGSLAIDIDARQVVIRGIEVETTAREFELLAFLARSPGTVFTRERLLQAVWNSSAEWQQVGTVTEHIRRLRDKIELDPKHPQWLQTVRGVGYRFERRHAGGRSDANGVERRAHQGDEIVLASVPATDRLVQAGDRG